MSARISILDDSPAARAPQAGTSGSGVSERKQRQSGPRQGARARGTAPASTGGQQFVVDLTADDDGDDKGHDDDVVVVKVKPGVRRLAPSPAKRARQEGQGHARHAGPAGFGAQPAAAAAPPPPPASPDKSRTCAICLDKMEQMASTPCGHVFCHQCLIDCVKANKKCPKCRKSVTAKQIHRIYMD